MWQFMPNEREVASDALVTGRPAGPCLVRCVVGAGSIQNSHTETVRCHPHTTQMRDQICSELSKSLRKTQGPDGRGGMEGGGM